VIDKDLFIAENARVVATPGPNWTFGLLQSNWIDFRVATDWARGSAVCANFRISSLFNNQAGNLLRFAVVVDGNSSFSNVNSTPELLLARSHDLTSAMLSNAANLGAVVPVALPPYGDLLRGLGEGFRYLTLGVQFLVPTTDWISGGIDAFFAPQPLPARPLSVPSGF